MLYDIYMNEQHPGGNTGFVDVAPQPGDFIAGAETGITALPLCPDGDWRPFYPQFASQLMRGVNGTIYGDTNACVSFGGCQYIETLQNFRNKKGFSGVDNLNWLYDNGYLDAQGRLLLSKRFTARMSNTDPEVGNTLPNVWNSLRHDGAVPDSMWPMPMREFDDYGASGDMNPDGYWLIYYKKPPQAAINLGKEFAARFDIQYEWVAFPAQPATPAVLAESLTHAPLEIATAVCSDWNNDDPIEGCKTRVPHHATLMSCVEENRYDILDHYVLYQKHLSIDYPILYAMRGMIRDKVVAETTHFTYTFLQDMQAGDPASPELHKLQEALQHLKKASGTPYMKVGIFGPYGPQTQAAVATFQMEQGIGASDKGAHFGPKTRAALNRLTSH